MTDVKETSLVLDMIFSIIAIIDAINQVYETVKNESSLSTNFKKSATKLSIISKLLDDAKRYLKATNESIKTAFTLTLESCKVQATHFQKLFEKIMSEENDLRWNRHIKAAWTIEKSDRVESLMKKILQDLQLLATKFSEVTTSREKDQLTKTVEKITRMKSSLLDDFEQMSAYAHYDSDAQNVNIESDIQHINFNTSHQNFDFDQQYIDINHIDTSNS